MAELTLTCKVCGEDFLFTDGEQAFFAEKGFEQPKKCPGCRKAAKEARKAKEVKNG